MTGNGKIKCVVVGDGAVGKTCMLVSYCTDHFPEEYVPTIFDNYTVDLNAGGETVKLELWDTAGQEAYEQLRPLSYADTDVFIIDYSCVDRQSFNNVEKWFKELSESWKDKTRPVPIVLVGTKKDLITDDDTLKRLEEAKETVVSVEEAEQMATKLNFCCSLQCSAKTQEGLKTVFDKAVNFVLKYRAEEEASSSSGCCSVM